MALSKVATRSAVQRHVKMQLVEPEAMLRQ